MKNISNIGSIIFSGLVFVLWIMLGIWLFSIEPFDYSWSRGEIGDFLNGLAAISLIFIGPTAMWQYKQLQSQQVQNYEEGVFRTFEMLKPELENLSVRIVAKTIKKADKKELFLENESFNCLLNKYKFDKTCFMRVIQKPIFLREMSNVLKDENHDFITSILRFRNMMDFLNNYVEEKGSQNDFKKALQSTELFLTYKSLNTLDLKL